MLRPVGSQPPSVYWRRRLMLLAGIAGVIVLLVITINTAFGGGSSGTEAGSTATGGTATGGTGAGNTVTGGTGTAGAPTAGSGSSVHSATRSSRPTSTGPASPTTSGTGSTATVMPKACSPANLVVAAVVGKSTYPVTADPLVELQVTNIGTAPCVQDMADKQIELRVYNGTSRVWGSHDCAVQPGVDKRTLALRQPYRYGIRWGGLTSEVGCTQATRQHIGAGTYTLYASLSGKTGTSAQFTIS